MFYIAVSIVFYALIDNAPYWYTIWRNERISKMIKRGYIVSPDGRHLKIEK